MHKNSSCINEPWKTNLSSALVFCNSWKNNVVNFMECSVALIGFSYCMLRQSPLGSKDQLMDVEILYFIGKSMTCNPNDIFKFKISIKTKLKLLWYIYKSRYINFHQYMFYIVYNYIVFYLNLNCLLFVFLLVHCINQFK